jgi:hypothetical protein
MDGNSQQIATYLLQLLIDKARAEAALTDLNKTIAIAEMSLADRMDREGVQSIKVQGIEFTPHMDEDYALAGPETGKKWDESAAWFDWLKDNGLSDVIKVKESVHWATRKKVLSELVSEGKPLPDFIKERYLQTVKFNKSAVERLAVTE